jgi:peptidoglycan/xylan/chitin deacetylase (PgdA/CDA1 family)
MPGLLKTAALNTSRVLGVNRVMRWQMRSRVLILCYHGVIAQKPKDRARYANTVSVAEFQSQLEYLCRNYHPISAAELLACLRQQRPLPARSALVTFDDGYQNNLVAGEILLKYGVPCVFHVTTGYIGSARVLWTDELLNRLELWPDPEVPLPLGGTRVLPRNPTERQRALWEIKESCKKIDASRLEGYLEQIRTRALELREDPELFEFLNWDGVRKLAKNFEIGSHTVAHPILTRIPPARLEQELRESKQMIEAETGKPCFCIAYPNGGADDVSTAVTEAAANTGYKLGFTLAERYSGVDEDPLALSRFCVQGHLPASYFEFRTSGVGQMLA